MASEIRSILSNFPEKWGCGEYGIEWYVLIYVVGDQIWKQSDAYLKYSMRDSLSDNEEI